MKAKEFIPASKPRNPVAKNANAGIGGGAAGAHRDKKKEQKQGYEKHKGKMTERVIDADSYDVFYQPPLSKENKKIVARSVKRNLLDTIITKAIEKLSVRNPDVKKGDFVFVPSKDTVREQADTSEEEMDKTVSDLHKDVYGVRPDQEWGREWMAMSYDEKLKLYYSMIDQLDRQDMSEGSYTTEKQILTRIRQIMYDRKLSGTESNGGELNRLKQQLKDIRSQQGVSEGFFDIDDSIKGKIQNIVSDLSDIPGMWDHKAQTFTDAGMDKLKTVLKNNPKYIKYATNLTADDFDESVEDGRGTREFEVDGYTYITDLDIEDDNQKIFHMLKTPEGKTISVDFTPYAYMTKDDVELYVKLGMPDRQGGGPLNSKELQKMARIGMESGIPFTECPECRGPIFHISEAKKDACYHKVRSRYKVWPSAYASGALVQCRKKGAANWGNKSK